jgi:hypothetical protein
MTWPQVLPTGSNPCSCRCERAPLCQATDTTLTIQKVEAHIQKPHASRAWLGHPLKKATSEAFSVLLTTYTYIHVTFLCMILIYGLYNGCIVFITIPNPTKFI